jgi:hypothetical protein
MENTMITHMERLETEHQYYMNLALEYQRRLDKFAEASIGLHRTLREVLEYTSEPQLVSIINEALRGFTEAMEAGL